MKHYIAIGILALSSIASGNTLKPDHHLFYHQAANQGRPLNEALPIGNGAFGALISGGAKTEFLYLNLDSLWTGDKTETGAYQALGSLEISFPKITGKVKDYRRSLDLETARHHVSFTDNGIKHERRYFASFPDKVIVLSFSSDQPIEAEIELKDQLDPTKYTPFAGSKSTVIESEPSKKNKKPQKGHKSREKSERTIKKSSIEIQGRLSNGLEYATALTIRQQGGTVEKLGNKLRVSGTKSFEILFSTESDYAMSLAKNWKKDTPPVTLVREQLKNAFAKPLAKLESAHIADHQKLYQQFSLDLGASPQRLVEMPTDKRLKQFQVLFKKSQKVEDIDLQELIANYGRYLMIASSRKGTMPANLQGIWNTSNSPAWRSDYHSNINLQMNYWMTEPAGLGETHEALADYIMAMRDIQLAKTPEEVVHPNGKPAKRGWSIKTENGIFGGYSFKWNHPGAAWYALHLWEHYAFTEDRAFLENSAYPVLLETCQFWEDRLKKRPDGTLVVPDGWSPEHGPTEDGVTYDQMIVYDLFSNFIDAATILGRDKAYCAKVTDMRNRLLTPKIGHWGQLQEWETDRDDAKDSHRHVNHLFGLHPGRQISPISTPKLAEAAKVSLNARGDGGTGWSKGWKISFWARFHDGDRAHKLISEQITNNFYNNLFDFHPPFQIDGNFGNTAGVLEMLIQSHVRSNLADPLSPWVVHLLPALPSNWANGQVQGIRARGNLSVSIAWKNGTLQLAHVKSTPNKKVVLQYKSKQRSFKIPASGVLKVTAKNFTEG